MSQGHSFSSMAKMPCIKKQLLALWQNCHHWKQHVRTSAIHSFIGFWTQNAPKELDKQYNAPSQLSTARSKEGFLNPILPSYWFKNAPEYKLFLQTSVVTFVKCLLLSPLKVKTMKYYLICNPRKCPETTCLSLESCQNKVRGKVSLRTIIWGCGMRLPSQVELVG